ncbi:hypothetical protein JCM33374_g16 [Metschnikowia sp. JCM 33374]|nr:hypothetical protein JCM33374_g16 [Metschnikowia sp. JCM 33374]
MGKPHEPPPLPNRTSTLRRKKPPGPNPFIEDAKKTTKENVDDDETHSDDSKEALNRHVPENSTQKQPFWKFHVIRFGTCLYLTTNPTLRHLHCRNAPGYFVRISGNALGYSMVFEDIESGEAFVKIEKSSDRHSHHFTFQVHPKRAVEHGIVRHNDASDGPKEPPSMHNGENNQVDSSQAFLRQDLLAQNPLFRDLRNHDSQGQVPSQRSDITPNEDWSEAFSGALVRKPIPGRLLPSAPVTPMVNYVGKMIDGESWSLGSLPRFRESRINPNDTKYIAKKNVYFHRNFDDIDRYFEWAIPPARAVFRECESRSKKRAMRQFNRLSRVSSVSGSKHLPPSEVDASPYSEISSYYKTGDGVYFDKVPADDEPDHHHKLGWVTVYEDPQAFSKRGMFDLVVALTVAIGYERNLQYGDSENDAPENGYE